MDASKVKVEGPGIEPGIRAGGPADIDVDTRLAGDADLKVEVVDELNSPVECEVEEEEYGIYAITYYPKKKGKNTILSCNLFFLRPPILAMSEKCRNFATATRHRKASDLYNENGLTQKNCYHCDKV